MAGLVKERLVAVNKARKALGMPTLRKRVCFICERKVYVLRYHHVVPQKISREQGTTVLPKDGPAKIGLCTFCSKRVHVIFDHVTLSKMTASELKERQEITHYLRCILPRLIRNSIKEKEI